MSTITGFYTGSTESEVEKQFADLRDVHNAGECPKVCVNLQTDVR